MRRRSGVLALFSAALGVLAAAHLCYGAGFALFEGSARGLALGGAVVGRADDPSALYYNPAGITQLPGIQFMGGGTVIIPSTKVRSEFGGAQTSTETEDNVFLAPHFYATYQFNDSLWFGLGVFSPFGLGTEFDEDWPGRYNNYNAVIETLSINPNLAFKVTDKLSVAAGMTVMWMDLTLEKKVDLSRQNNPLINTFDVDSSLTGDSFGYGFNFAAHYKPFDWMSLGASYRSQIKQHIQGEADFTKPNKPFFLTQAQFDALFNDTDADGSIVLPDQIFLGACFKPFDRLTWEVGGVWTRWSTFDELGISFDVSPTGPGTSVPATAKDWNDVWRFQTGVEYKALDWLDLRVGFVWDQEPSPDETVDYLVPANDRFLYSAGLGFHWNNWGADVSYTFLDIRGRDVTARRPDGILDSEFRDGQAHLIGMSVSYKF
jgi:long-chain fatty acid transport protein